MLPAFFSVQSRTQRLSVCPEVHSSHLTFMSVHILTSSIFKAEKHERENSAHTIGSSCGIMTTFLLHSSFPTFRTYRRETTHFAILSLDMLLSFIGHCWNYFITFNFSLSYINRIVFNYEPTSRTSHTETYPHVNIFKYLLLH
jgi:hypothetical protein